MKKEWTYSRNQGTRTGHTPGKSSCLVSQLLFRRWGDSPHHRETAGSASPPSAPPHWPPGPPCADRRCLCPGGEDRREWAWVIQCPWTLHSTVGPDTTSWPTPCLCSSSLQLQVTFRAPLVGTDPLLSATAFTYLHINISETIRDRKWREVWPLQTFRFLQNWGFWLSK